MVTTEEGKKKRRLVDYQYDLGDCMFCQLCVNACSFDAIEFTNDFENSVFDRDKLVLHLDKEHYELAAKHPRWRCTADNRKV